MSEFKSAFISLVGLPNVGKSSLFNVLMNEKLAIVTSKAQTTRMRCKGLINEENFQLVLSDTPGLVKSAYPLHERMNNYVAEAIQDSDICLLVFDGEAWEINLPELYAQMIENAAAKKILLINKADKIETEKREEIIDNIKEHFQGVDVLFTSAKSREGISSLKDLMIEYAPIHPPYFSQDNVSDQSTRFFISEFIREGIFLNYRKEIPYASHVEVQSFKESNKITHIEAIIYVERDSQKTIVVGKGGKEIKKVGIYAREQTENFLGRKVFLELRVKVAKDWRKEHSKLERLGY